MYEREQSSILNTRRNQKLPSEVPEHKKSLQLNKDKTLLDYESKLSAGTRPRHGLIILSELKEYREFHQIPLQIRSLACVISLNTKQNQVYLNLTSSHIMNFNYQVYCQIGKSY